MNCEQIQRRLMAADRPEEPAADVTAHLVQCPRCRRFQDRLRFLEKAVPLLPVPTSRAKERLLDKVLQRAGKVAAPTPQVSSPLPVRSWRPRHLAYLAAAAVVLVAVGIWVGNFLADRLDTRGDAGLVKGNLKPQAPDAAAPLVGRLLDADLRLAEAKGPRQRLESLADLATALQSETEALTGAGGAKEMGQLARLYEKVVRDGVVVHAKDVPRDQRRQVLSPIAGQLIKVDQEARRQAAGAPPGTAAPLLQVANAARDGARQLHALMPEESTP